MKGSLVFVMLLLAVGAAPPAFVQEASAAAPGKLSKKQLQDRRFRALMSQAKLAAKKGKHAAAIALYDKALAIHPGHLPADRARRLREPGVRPALPRRDA